MLYVVCFFYYHGETYSAEEFHFFKTQDLSFTLKQDSTNHLVIFWRHSFRHHCQTKFVHLVWLWFSNGVQISSIEYNVVLFWCRARISSLQDYLVTGRKLCSFIFWNVLLRRWMQLLGRKQYGSMPCHRIHSLVTHLYRRLFTLFQAVHDGLLVKQFVFFSPQFKRKSKLI